MKQFKLKDLIKEQIQNVRLQLLDESIVKDIMSLILSPRVKKAIKTLRDDPDFKELEQQIKLAKDELEAINNRIEKNLAKREKVVQDMKKAGIKVDTNMDSTQMLQAYREWSDSIDKHIKIRGSKDAWQTYFNKK